MTTICLLWCLVILLLQVSALNLIWTKHEWFPWKWLLAGGKFSWVAIILAAVPFAWLLAEFGGGGLNQWALRSVAGIPESLKKSPGTEECLPVDFQDAALGGGARSPSVSLLRELGGVEQKSLLAVMPLEAQGRNAPDLKAANAVLLARYRAVDNRKPDAPPFMIIEVSLAERGGGCWRTTIDVGCPVLTSGADEPVTYDWKRVPWWQKDGIATSNAILDVSPFWAAVPGTWVVNTPTTASAVCAYMKDYYLAAAKAIDPYIWQKFPIDGKSFERGVVSPLMQALPQDFGSVSTMASVFCLGMCCGPLQWFMWLLFLTGLWLSWIRIQSIAVAKVSVEDRERINGFQRQLEASVIYFGLLGTLVYLSLAIMQLRIHPSSAVMQSIISTMSVSMAQAFLTTVVSCSLQRFGEFVREHACTREVVAG